MNKPQLDRPLQDLSAPVLTGDVWRPIHYLGSKLRLVEPLRLAIDQVTHGHGRVCDLFAGSGTVSAALSATYEVVSIDIQEYARVLCSAVLNPPAMTGSEASAFVASAFGTSHHAGLDAASALVEYERTALRKAAQGNPEAICELIEHASMVAFRGRAPGVSAELQAAHAQVLKRIKRFDDRHTLVLRHFGGLYFSYSQAVALDSLLIAAHRQPAARRDTFLAAIISTASEVVNTVGKHFAQPIRPRGADGKPKRHLIAKIVRDRELDVRAIFLQWLDRYRSLRPTGRKHRVIRADFVDALGIIGNVSAVYADPPYTRDHYSRFYHVLETMCLWDDPGVSTTRIRSETETFSRGVYRADRHQSPFCIKSQAPAAFARLFAGVRDLRVPLVLSYSPYAADGKAHPRVMTVECIHDLASKYFNRVERISAGRISHMKLNATKLHLDASAEAELLFICS
jgi:adenine-specific DNA-methyltransferase